MENTDNRLTEFIEIVKSWIPGRSSDPVNLSRDFWMPDDSCRVCYECDSQFTIFNRRHHCRLCGRVFCAKCTANSISVHQLADDLKPEDGDRIRVCNYCFKQHQQQQLATDSENGAVVVASPVLSPSMSTASLASSTKSSCTGNSSTTTVGSVSHSTEAYQIVSCSNSSAKSQVHGNLEACKDKQDSMISERNMDSIANMGDRPSSNHFEFCMNRSDDDDYDEDYGGFPTDRYQHCNDYYGSVDYDDVAHSYGSNKENPSVDSVDAKDFRAPAGTSEFHDPLGADKGTEEAVPNNSYDCDISSSMYGIETKDVEPVDFENNGLLWLPPEPEDEEDDKEPIHFEEDDDEDATGEWGYLRTSNSFGSGESRHRDRSSEEHKKAIKDVVDGHFRALVAQLLQVENLPIGEEDDTESWLQIITTLSWEAATHLKPDTSKGGGMDPGGYVKVKCIATGRRSESMVVKGIVCKKNVAHRRMQSKVEKPRLLILGGALEYQRVQNSLSCLDTLLQQEMDHLKMAVAKIDAHHPNVLLVEKAVSRFAQDCLLAKNISLVLNIKRPLLERIARCTGAQIVPSIDHLSSPKLGYCDLFHVEKFLEEHGSAGQGGKKLVKTLMFFEGCPKPLGCTILLRGASGDELKKVKHVIQYGIFAAYHLALETSFLADEGASLPELPLKSPITVALPDKPSSIDRSISTIPGFTIPSAPKLQSVSNVQRVIMSNESNNIKVPSSPIPAGGRIFSNFESASLVNISSVDMGGYSLHTNKWEEHAVQPQNRISSSPSSPSKQSLFDNSLNYAFEEKSTVGFQNFFEDGASLSCQDNNQNDELQLSKEEFPPSPSDHQSILVSLSTRCVWKGTVCERAHLFRIKYYGSFDKPLGRFLRDHLFDQSYRCHTCEMPSEAHIYCYTHRQGSLTISVRKLTEFPLPGERDGKIWMWHRCLKCPRDNGFPPATRRVVMSDAAWGLSFGKFLELSFSNHAAASRVASCGHSLHRDCLRFYGFGRMVACFRYAPININSVYLPPPVLDFSHQPQEWIEKEVAEVADKGELLFSEVLNVLCQIEEKRRGSSDENEIQESRRHIAELEWILQKEKTEFEEIIQSISEKEVKKGQPILDILQVNKLRRKLVFLSYLWDQRLLLASSPDSKPHEVLCSVMIKIKKISSVDKMVEVNHSPKLVFRSSSLDIPPSDSQNEPSKRKNCIDQHEEGLVVHPNDEQRKYLEHDTYQGRQQKAFLSSSSNLAEHLGPLESGISFRRVVSDGQFPVIANLSETLDAKWTGENGPRSSDTRDLEATSAVSAISEDKKQSGPRLLGSVLPTSLADTEDLSVLLALPFQNFYCCINKNWGITIKLDALSEYIPVHISSFIELIHQGRGRWLLPLGVKDTVIPIYDEEPTSIISYALVSPDYHFQMSDEREKPRDNRESSISLPISDSGSFHSFQSADESISSFRSSGSTDDSILSTPGSKWNSQIVDPLTITKSMHVRVSFADEGPLGKVKYSVTCYYAKQFEALRKTCCPSELDFIRSLSRCKKWGAQGGKSNVFFAKSLDDRFIVKQVTKTELESFIKFATEYFKYLTESIATGSPTCLAKILGIYQVTAKHLKGGKETKMDVLVMENLLFGRNVTRLYDLKGSSRSRYNPDSSGNNKVLLDQNLIEAIPTSPIFVGNKAKRLLERAVWNDTSFLASIDVMDYSLLVGVDEGKHELVLGIIDFMRQYTWDKHLETWVKASGILGGPKNASPTVISPMQYKRRFRKAMSAYFYMVPEQWQPPTIMPSKSLTDLKEDNPDS